MIHQFKTLSKQYSQFIRFVFEEEQLESLQVLHAIRDNIPLNQVADIDSRQKLLSADSLTNLFSNRFPQAVDNLRDLVAGFLIN